MTNTTSRNQEYRIGFRPRSGYPPITYHLELEDDGTFVDSDKPDLEATIVLHEYQDGCRVGCDEDRMEELKDALTSLQQEFETFILQSYT